MNAKLKGYRTLLAAAAIEAVGVLQNTDVHHFLVANGVADGTITQIVAMLMVLMRIFTTGPVAPATLFPKENTMSAITAAKSTPRRAAVNVAATGAANAAADPLADLKTNALAIAAQPIIAALDNLIATPTTLNVAAQGVALQGALIGAAPQLESLGIADIAALLKQKLVDAIGAPTVTAESEAVENSTPAAAASPHVEG